MGTTKTLNIRSDMSNLKLNKYKYVIFTFNNYWRENVLLKVQYLSTELSDGYNSTST